MSSNSKNPSLKPIPGDSTNNWAKALMYSAFIVWGLGAIGGYVLGYDEYYEFNFGLAFAAWITTFIAGLLLGAFSEVISLLQSLVNNKYELLDFDFDITIANRREVNGSLAEEQKSQIQADKQQSEITVKTSNPNSDEPAHFPIRIPGAEVRCPRCGTMISSRLNFCYQCGKKFIYDKEVKTGNQ